VQEAAYESLLKRTRQQLHSRVVDVLLAQFPERAAAEPEVVARHAELAGRMDDAITYHQRAGEHAQARSAYKEAIGHLGYAIALLATRPEGGERDTREAALQLALGGSLAAAGGYAHPESEAAYERARVLCEALDDAWRLGLALIGLAGFYETRGEVERGRVLAARVLTAAEQSADIELALNGHQMVASTEFFQGKFASSLVHCEAARTLYEVERHHAAVSALAADPGVAVLAIAAWNLWGLGWPDRALTRAREAVVLARQLNHPFSSAYALFFETVLHWLRRDITAQCERAGEVIALSEAQGFPLWLGVGRAFHAAARVAAGETGAAADLLTGLALTAEMGFQAGAPAIFALLGEAYMAAGQVDEARGAVEAGIAIASTGQQYTDSELHRLQGEIVLKTVDSQESRVDSPQTAEECFLRALDIARGQEAKSPELRAATSLARLWRDQGKRDAARALLAPLYAWFTEGFDTRDLQAAKALLEELR